MVDKPRGEAAPPQAAQCLDGVFTAVQALQEGYTARQVRRLVVTGRWRLVVGRGLTARSPGRTDERGEPCWPPLMLARAAHLTWPDAVVALRVAAAVHGFPVAFPVAPGPHVDVLLRCRRRPCHGVIPHRVPFLPGETALLPGDLPVTSPIRTAVDCLSTFDPDEAWPLLAWLVTHRRFDRAHLTDHLSRRTGRLGTAQLRALHAWTASGALSPPERQLHYLLDQAGLIGWVANVPVRDHNGLIGIVDVLFREARVAVEIDGFVAHSNREAFVIDRQRQNRLALAGYQVLRFTWWDISGRPDGVIYEIRDAVRRRGR